MVRIIPFAELATSDLMVDAVYERCVDGQISGGANTQTATKLWEYGGSCFRSRPKKNQVVLFTTGEDKDWPNILDTNLVNYLFWR